MRPGFDSRQRNIFCLALLSPIPFTVLISLPFLSLIALSHCSDLLPFGILSFTQEPVLGEDTLLQGGGLGGLAKEAESGDATAGVDLEEDVRHAPFVLRLKRVLQVRLQRLRLDQARPPIPRKYQISTAHRTPYTALTTHTHTDTQTHTQRT